MDVGLSRALTECLGNEPRSITRISGGDIGNAHRLELSDGRTCFVKSYGASGGAMIEAEAAGLRWLRRANAIRVPTVIAARTAEPALLVLEWIETGAAGPRFDEQLGQALAQLHSKGPAEFGWDRDNFIGRLPQSNRRHGSWASFYARERIEPQLRMARESGALSASLTKDADSLIDRLPELCGPRETPARLHGDLWGGNSMVDAEGRPCLIDPAVYGGHREIDLAMMRLFGGFSKRVFDAYHEARPLAPGHEDRTALYQLYPLLVHLNLFGGGYAGSVERILRHYL